MPTPPRSTLFPYTTLFRSVLFQSAGPAVSLDTGGNGRRGVRSGRCLPRPDRTRSEEHTSELQSQFHLVCRLLLEKKKNCRLGVFDKDQDLLAQALSRWRTL